MARHVTDYPSKPCIRHLVDAARSVGLNINTIAVKTDGTVILSDTTSDTVDSQSEVDRWFAEQDREAL